MALLNKICPIVALLGCACLAGTLSGKVVDLDGSARSGVVVALAGTDISDTTGPDGSWSIRSSAGIEPRGAVRHFGPSGGRWSLRDGRLVLDLQGRTASGSHLPGATSVTATVSACRGLDQPALRHLVYSVGGRAFLRDTISESVGDRQGMLRRFDTTANPEYSYGYVPDTTGRLYRTAAIGNQVWMAENYDLPVDSSWCFADSRDSCDRYGRLYSWAAAMALPDSCDSRTCPEERVHRGICPNGWHVPSDDEWTRLGDTTIPSDPGTVLKAAKFWRLDTPSDPLGFGALAGGWRAPPDFLYTTQVGYWWSSTQAAGGYSWYRKIQFLSENLTRDANPKGFGYSLRCIQDK